MEMTRRSTSLIAMPTLFEPAPDGREVVKVGALFSASRLFEQIHSSGFRQTIMQA